MKVNLKKLPVEISETDRFRSLHLETDSIQSSMDISDPIHLTLKYTQVTVLLLLFKRHPTNITILGLGAGSLTKFFFYFCARTKLQTIEINRQVINVARMMFEVPKDTSRHKVIEQDAMEFLTKKNKHEVLISDLFDGYGIPKQFTQKKYFQICHDRITKQGIFIINLWGSDKNTPRYIKELKDIFSKAIVVESDDPGNIMVFCFKEHFKFSSNKQMEYRLKLLQAKINFDLNFFYKRMLKRNKQLFENIHCH